MKIKYNGDIKASATNDYIYVIMNNGDPVAKGTYDAMTKKSLTYSYPVTIKKFPKAKLNSLMKMAKEARRPDPLKFAVNRFINDYPDEYRTINSSCGRKPIKSAVDGKLPYDLVSMLVVLRDYVDTSSAYVSDEHNKLVDIADSMYNAGLDIDEMRPEYKSVYEKYGQKFFDTVLKDASAIDSQINSNNLNDLIADYEDRANSFIGVEGACSGKRKSVRAAAVMAGPGAGYTIKWNLESINNINSFNVTNVSEPDEYGLITVEADCDVDVTVEIVEAYSYYYGIDRPINDVAAKMTKVSFEIDPDQWPELGSFYDVGVDFAAEFLNNEIYDTISNGEVMYGGGWSHSTWDGTLTDYEHDGLIEIKVTDEETIEYVDDAVSGELEGAYDDVEESERINATKSNKRRGNMKIRSSQKTARANMNSIKAATDITNLKILIDNVGYVEVYEDGYETGEGKYANAWDFDISGTYDSMQEVVDAISNQVGTSKDINDYVYIDGRIDTDMEQNAEGLAPTDAEYEAWRRGEETLYVAHISVYLKVGAEVHDMTEDEAEAFGLPLY